MTREFGVWHVQAGPVPSEAKWVVTPSPAYGKPNLLFNPDFELGHAGLRLSTPSGTTPMTMNILPGYAGNSVVLVSDELVYKGGLRYDIVDAPPNTTFQFKVMIRTVDVEALEVRSLYVDIYVGGTYHSSYNWGKIYGSQDWTLYEISFTTPDQQSRLTVLPALVYNRGEVWIDNISLTMEGWQPPTTPAILDWIWMHDSGDRFETAAELEYVEQWLKSIPTQNFWGLISPIRHEHYRIHVTFNDDVDTTWFGENLLGYPLYLAEVPSATIEDWKDEMWLRMVRGHYNYFSPKIKIGLTAGGGSMVAGWKDKHFYTGTQKYWGTPALSFISEHYDFVCLYAYTWNLQFFNDWTREYFDLIDQHFAKLKKFWKVTRIWSHNVDYWEPEAIALEMKNSFDRGMINWIFAVNDPPFEEVWSLMLRARELYNAKAPYTESLVPDRNLLTDYVGDTYGWVANPENDEDLYPTLISSFPVLGIGAGLGAGAGYAVGGNLGSAIGTAVGTSLAYAITRYIPLAQKTACVECSRKFMFTNYETSVWCPFCGREQVVKRRE